MSVVVFRNAGVIDPRSITTFGVSSKERAGAIGFFGTGLKYAIAILLREGCEITVHAGKKPLNFALRRTKVRVDEFDMVTMNRRQLGFTTDLGKTWEVWQALRELYCNCMDEGGEAFQADEAPEPRPGDTTIVVSGEKFLEAWAKRSEVILDTDPLYKLEAVHIHPGHSEFAYYRGVRAYRLGRPSMFTYNIQRRVDLTEDRTIKYEFELHRAIRAGLTALDDSKVISAVVTAPKEYAEHELSFEGEVPSETFVETVAALARGFDSNLSASAMRTCRLWAGDRLLEQEGATLSDLELKRLDRAATFCERLGFPVREYPIIASEFLGSDVLGMAHDDKIFVSKRVFMMGTKMLAGTLVEEFLHLRHKLYDETRTMQNFLMDTIVSLGEQITGEPL